ncbi:MAG: ABC transporter permease subunit [Burkholderiales bacterium]|jgi:sulfonate transport system permease protein|nr:ABC transporter permease subunit [Burkholderiales bacterium]
MKLIFFPFFRFRGLLNRLLPWLVPIIIVILWQWASSRGQISSRIAPSPVAVLEAAWELTKTGELLKHLWASFLRASAGFTLGAAIGFVFGVANGMSRRFEILFDTTLQMARNIPHLAMIPLLILWFGIGEESKLFLVVLGVFFPVYINTFHGIRSVDAGLVEMGESYGLSKGQLFLQVILPGALPSILVGVRYALGFTWLTLIVAEMIAAPSGIGYMAMTAREFMQTDVVLLSILLYALLGKLADTSSRRLERGLLAWQVVAVK